MLSAVALCVAVADRAVGEVPPGFEIVHITDNPNDYSRVPKINNCGEVVFETWIDQGPGEIFLYDNGHLKQITDDDIYDAWPDLNENGTIVWSRGVGSGFPLEIALLRDGELSILTDNAVNDYAPRINNLDIVVWDRDSELGCSGSQVYAWDGVSTTQITDNVFQNSSPEINDQGVIVWGQRDFCPLPWEYSVMKYSDGETEMISGNDTLAHAPVINNAGWIVWQYEIVSGSLALGQLNGAESGIFLDWGSNAEMNESGDLFFLRWHDDTDTWQVWLYFSNGSGRAGDGEILQLTNDSFWNTNGDLNDYREVAWKARNFPQSDIYLMRRIRDGDADFDGDVDVNDFARFTDCLSGPIPGDRLCDCRFLDLDHDRDVDFADFGAFQRMFGGNE